VWKAPHDCLCDVGVKELFVWGTPYGRLAYLGLGVGDGAVGIRILKVQQGVTIPWDNAGYSDSQKENQRLCMAKRLRMFQGPVMETSLYPLTWIQRIELLHF